jgi:hypothetical protein
MSPRASRYSKHAERVAGQLTVVGGQHPARAPLEPEHREPVPSSPAPAITQAAIDEWASTDPVLEQLRFEVRHGVLY